MNGCDHEHRCSHGWCENRYNCNRPECEPIKGRFFKQCPRHGGMLMLPRGTRVTTTTGTVQGSSLDARLRKLRRGLAE